MLHEKPTGPRLEDISIKMVITEKPRSCILSDPFAVVRAQPRRKHERESITYAAIVK